MNRYRVILFVLPLFAIPLIALASEGQYSPPPPVAGKFQVRILHTKNRGEFMENFSLGRKLPVTDTVARNGRLDRMVLLSGCKPDGKGECNVTAQVKVFDPLGDTELYTMGNGIPIHVAKSPPRAGTWSVSDAPSEFSLMFWERKSVGDYLVQVTFTDNNSGEERVAWQVVHVT